MVSILAALTGLMLSFAADGLPSACLAQESSETPSQPATAEPAGGSTQPENNLQPGITEQPEQRASEPPTIREQSIYIPYTRLRTMFEKEGRGVFLPYEKFQELWEAARRAQQRPAPERPPVGVLISAMDAQATVSGDVMIVRATLEMEILSDGWHLLPLRLQDAAVRSATLDGQPARLVHSPDLGYQLLLHKQNSGATGADGSDSENEPDRHTLILEFSKAYTKAPGTNQVEFQPPQAPVSRWQITIPEPGVKVNVYPQLAASTAQTGDEPQEPGNESEGDANAPDATKNTVVQAFVGAADRVRIEWTAKAEGAAGLAALVTVQARQELLVDEGIVRTRAHLSYDISRAEIRRLVIEVPADQNVVNVFDPNIQRWEKESQGGVQRITVTLFQPTRGLQNVLLELEKFTGERGMPQDMMQAEVQAPVIRATQVGTEDNLVAVGRQQGVVVVRLGAALRGEATTRNGLLQIDANELPAPLAGQSWTFAYRYAALPYELVLRIDKVLPQVDVEELVEVYLDADQLTANLLAVLNIERAGIFQVELEVPAGYEVRRVEGREHAGASPLQVDSFDVEPVAADPARPNAPPANRLKVNLGRRALGRAGLWVELARRLDDPNLLQPTGNTSTLAIPIPRVVPASVQRSGGRLLLYAPESLRVNPQQTSGLRPVSPAEAVQTLPSTRNGRFPELRELLAFAYTQEPATLDVQVQRRKPYIEARQWLSTHVESGVVRFDAVFFFDVRYSSVKSLRLDVPQALVGEIRNLTPALREQPIDPQPEDVPQDYVAWQLAGEGDLLGQVVARFQWERKLGDIPVGQSVRLEIPRLIVPGVDRSWGQITASKAETIEISVDGEPSGLRPIDPLRDLMPGASGGNAARAFEFYGDWSLTLQATRYELEELKRTSIDQGLVRMVVTRGDEIAVQAVYRLRSARQRVAILLPGVDPRDTSSSLDAQPLRVNSQPAPLEHDGTRFFIPLTGHTADEPVLIELRYTVRGTASLMLVPEFPEDPAVQKIYLSAYLPDERALVAVRGPWTDESLEPWLQRPVEEPPSDDQLLNQLRQGTQSPPLSDSFPLDGQRFLFASLRPETGNSGALQLNTINKNLLQVLVMCAVALVGVALTLRPVGIRLWWLGGLLAVVALLAVFAPHMAQAVTGPALFLALVLVLAAWGLRWLAWLLPGIAAWLSARFREARQAPPPPQPREHAAEHVAGGDVEVNSPEHGSPTSPFGQPPGKSPPAANEGESGGEQPKSDGQGGEHHA